MSGEGLNKHDNNYTAMHWEYKPEEFDSKTFMYAWKIIKLQKSTEERNQFQL